MWFNPCAELATSKRISNVLDCIDNNDRPKIQDLDGFMEERVGSTLLFNRAAAASTGGSNAPCPAFERCQEWRTVGDSSSGRQLGAGYRMLDNGGRVLRAHASSLLLSFSKKVMDVHRQPTARRSATLCPVSYVWMRLYNWSLIHAVLNS
jgi:hypothetical protein